MRYFQRSIKYFLSLCLVYAAMLYLMSFTEMMVITRGETFRALFSTPRGFVMLLAVVALSAGYPYFGFIKRKIKGNLAEEEVKQLIHTAFELQHFKLLSQDDRRLVFIAESPLRRLFMLFEDHILVTQVGDEIEIRGNRKAVAYIIFRLDRAITLLHEREEELAHKSE